MTSASTILESRAKMSKPCTPDKIIRLLRHNLEIAKVADKFGFVALYDLNTQLKLSSRNNITEEEFIALADNKFLPRLFEYKSEPWNYTYNGSNKKAKELELKTKAEKVFMVRAIEGHSFAIKELPVEPFVLPNKDNKIIYLYHLTNHRLVSDIMRRGLGPEVDNYVILHENRSKFKNNGPLNTILEIGPIDSYLLQVELPMQRAASGRIITKKIIPPSLIRVVLPSSK